MSQRIDIAVKEVDVVRLFAVNLPEAEARALADAPAGLAGLLGVEALNTDFLEIFSVADLAAIGLGQYLQDGYGVPESALAQDAAKLSQISGYGVVVLSSAVEARPATLSVGPELTLIASYAVAGTDWQADDSPTPEAAQPYSAPEAARKKPSDAAMSGRIAMAALLVLTLIVLLMVWIA
ncbi:MAG: hypothetical protein HRU30_17485 [Rhodobacteraceae bacterium]|nr:hypothetical protein [Paracoccaceae bacterium]